MTRTESDPRIDESRTSQRIGAGWPRYLDAPIRRPRDAVAVAACCAVGVVFDLAVRSGVAGAGGALAIVVACVALAGTGRLRNRQSIVLMAAAPLFGIWLVLRASEWLLPFNLVATCGLVLLATSLSSGGSFWDLPIPSVVARAAQAATQAILAPAFLLAGRGGAKKRNVSGIVRGLIVAIPVLLVLRALLASSDVVFASFFDVDLGNELVHAGTIAFGILAMAALLRLSSVEHVDVPTVRGPRLGTQEWAVVLGLLNLMLGAFAVARLIALSEGGQRVIRSAGLTYAEYARSGFFQLLAASLLTIGVIAALHATADVRTSSERKLFLVLSLGLVVLSLALVASAFHRIVLYEQAFGITMLRLYAQTALVWVGLVLVFLGAWIAGVGGSRTWVWSAAGMTALVMLFAMNVFNPEAFVVRHNVTHQTSTRFDPSYVDELGDDAVPELAKHPELKRYACMHDRIQGLTGWAAYNLAGERATDVRTRVCGKLGG